MTKEHDLDAITDANLAAAMGMDEGEVDLDPYTEPAQADATEMSELVTDAEDDTEDTVDISEAEQVEDDEQLSGEESAESEGESMAYAESTAIKAALAGDGLPQDLIEALTSDQLRSYMASRKTRDDAFDRMRDKVNASKAPSQDNEEKIEDGGAPNEPDKPASLVDLTALTEEFGENEAKSIAGYVEAAVGPLQTANDALIGALEQMIDTAQRSRLAGVVPDGLGDGWFEKVRDRAMELGNAGTYQEKIGTERTDALFDAALRLEFPDSPSPAEMKRESKRAKQRRNGSPSRSGRVAKKSSALTKDEKENMRLEMAMDGKSVLDIQRAVDG